MKIKNKWYPDYKFIGLQKKEVERIFLNSYNDYIGKSTMESLKDEYRVKRYKVERDYK